MKNVVLIGATGYVGTALLNALVETLALSDLPPHAVIVKATPDNSAKLLNNLNFFINYLPPIDIFVVIN